MTDNELISMYSGITFAGVVICSVCNFSSALFFFSNPPSSTTNRLRLHLTLYFDMFILDFVLFRALFLLILPLSVYAATAEQWRGRSIYQSVNVSVLQRLSHFFCL